MKKFIREIFLEEINHLFENNTSHHYYNKYIVVAVR